MLHLTLLIAGSRKYEILKNLSKTFYVSGRYVTKAMFSNGKYDLCALGLSVGSENHEDTFWIHKKSTTKETLKHLKKAEMRF